jgi:pimeloyl-ACP methyl ester carboxylesterase
LERRDYAARGKWVQGDCGRHAWANDGAYDLRDFAADLVAIAATLECKPALIGASLGGMAGLVAEGELARGCFASLTLVDIAPQVQVGGVTRVVEFMTARARDGFSSPEEAAQLIADYLPHRPGRKASSGLAHYLRQKEDGRFYWHWDPAFLDRVLRTREAHARADDLAGERLNSAAAQLTLPVHLIRGGSSDLVSPEDVAHFQRLVTHAEFSDIPGATHMVVGDQNDSFGRAILGFLVRMHPRPAMA